MERPRRLRQSESIRGLVEETRFSAQQLIWPLFVCEGTSVQKSHPHLPGALTLSVDQISNQIKEGYELGLRSILLFGVSSKKDLEGTEALNPEAPVCRAIREIRERYPKAIIATDIALDPYTDHGHDGIFKNGQVLNDESVQVLQKMAVLHAKQGAHIVSPSDMMDGRVAAIRSALDASGFSDATILSYTAKYASCLYGPFRETLGAEVVGDKKSYQMNPRNRIEALRELRLDAAEGADIMMVKPASWYLDVISDFKRASDRPFAAYQVSGECAMIELGAKAGLFDRERAILESATSIFRAGADILATYFARDLARMIKKN